MCVGTVKFAVKRNGFLNQKALAKDIGLARSIVSNFLTGKPVYRVVFEEVCDRLSLNWQEVAEFEEGVLQRFLSGKRTGLVHIVLTPARLWSINAL